MAISFLGTVSSAAQFSDAVVRLDSMSTAKSQAVGTDQECEPCAFNLPVVTKSKLATIPTELNTLNAAVLGSTPGASLSVLPVSALPVTTTPAVVASSLAVLPVINPSVTSTSVTQAILEHLDRNGLRSHDHLIGVTQGNTSNSLSNLQALNAGAGLLGKNVRYGTESGDVGVDDQIKPDNGSILVRIGDQVVPIAHIVSVE